MYRVTHLLTDLGWVDFDLGCSTARWAVLQLLCCPSKTVEHPKSKSTQPRSARRWVTLYSATRSFPTKLDTYLAWWKSWNSGEWMNGRWNPEWSFCTMKLNQTNQSHATGMGGHVRAKPAEDGSCKDEGGYNC